MPRVPGIRLTATALAVLVAGTMLVALVTGVDDGISAAVGLALSSSETERLERALREIMLVRGLFVGLASALLAFLVGGAIRRALATATAAASREPRPSRAARPASRPWLREARELEDAIASRRQEHRSALERADRERLELNLFVDAISEGVLQLDADGRIARANAAAHHLLGLPETVAGKTFDVVVRSAELRDALRGALHSAPVPPREVEFGDRTLVVSAQPIHANGGARGENRGAGAGEEPGGLAVTIADLTPVRRLESIRRDFVANASHELKTPLTSIRGYAETLLGEELGEDMRRQFLETIFSNADRLQHVIDDLLDLSRLESGRWQPEMETVGPAELARATWRDFEQRSEARAIRFEVDAREDARVSADTAALRHILSNLYDNALRYTPDGGRITTRVASEGELIALEVSDTGSGIPGDALPRIFERFYRVDPARSRAEGGTGLGLSIVKHLTESMGGRVEAESQLGKGTAVRVYLPAAGRAGAD